MVNINLRNIVSAILGMIAAVHVCAFGVFSSQSDDRLMTEKEKYEVLDSVCAALGMSIYDGYIITFEFKNEYHMSEREVLADSLIKVLEYRGKKKYDAVSYAERSHFPYAKITCKKYNSIYKSSYGLHKLNPMSRMGAGDFCYFKDGTLLDLRVDTEIECPPYEGGIIMVESFKILDENSRETINNLTDRVYNIKAELINNPEYEIRYSFNFDYDGSSYEVSGSVVSGKVLKKYMTSYNASMEFRDKYGMKLKKIK